MAAHAASASQHDQTYDLGGGSAEWAAWYAQYLTRSTSQSAKSLELFQQVLECVARGQLAPSALQDLLPGFAQARGAEHANKLTALSSRFFSGLVQIGTLFLQEQAELVTPGIPTSEASPPQFDATDPVKWFQQLTDYAGQLSARAAKIYQSHLERAAAGDTAPSQLQQATSDYFARRLPVHLRKIGKLYFDLLNGLNEVLTSYQRDYLSSVLANANRGDKEAPFVLNLSAALNETASASLSLANTNPERAIIRCSVSDVRRADGVGPAFAPKVTITPDSLELASGEEGILRLSLLLDESDYDVDALYVGAVHVTGHGEPRIEVPLRIIATQSAAAAKDTTSTTHREP